MFASVPTRVHQVRLVANSRAVRFVLTGALNTAFGLCVYPLLLWLVPALRTHYLLALGGAQIASTLFAYASYKLVVFRTRAGVVREAGLFGSFYVVVSGINWLVLPLLVEVVRLPPIAAQLGFSLVLMVASYLWHSRITFRPARPTDAR